MDRKKEKLEKPRAELLPGKALLEVIKVLTFGAKKHGAESWKGYPRECYLAAMMRHWCKLQEGEVYDDETGLHHAAHIACSALFMVWLDETIVEPNDLLISLVEKAEETND